MWEGKSHKLTDRVLRFCDSVVSQIAPGCLRAEPRSSDSERAYIGYVWLRLLRLEASREVRRRRLGLLCVQGIIGCKCQRKLYNT